MRVLFVCTGNTCRSPLAEGIMRAMLADRGVVGISVSSAGTGAVGGEPASEGSYLVALEQGIDLSTHRARQLSADLVESADLILTMSAQHAEAARALGGDERVHLLGEYAGRRGDAAEVLDPFGADLDLYRETGIELRALIEDALERLEREAGRDQG